jgi:tRNA threonylcarbamoyladenosine biosynthesis protein TsaB
MTILALEFSSARRGAALARGGTVLSEAVETTGGRTTNAFGLIEKVLTEAKVLRGEVEVIVVGIGPGSYAGIRAAIALAQGWQLARGIQLLGVSSAECLAAQAQAEKIFGRVNVVIDAQRNEFYVAASEISAAGRRETGPLQILTAAETRSRAAEIFFGPAAAVFRPDGNNQFPSAAMLARLAGGRTDFVPGENLEPIYLRETNFVKAPPTRL